MGRTGIQQQGEASDTDDNLFEPKPQSNRIRGDYGTTAEHLAVLPKTHPIRFALGISLPLLLGYGLLRYRRA